MRNYRYREKRAMWIKRITAIGICFVTAILLSFLIITYVVQKYNVTGDSMEPTFYDGESVYVNKFAYLFGDPKRLDVALIKIERGSGVTYAVKRIVAIPGDTVYIDDGVLYVNDAPSGYEYDEKIISPGLASYGVTLKENEYFVMGDNCNNSEDSRKVGFGNVPRHQIIGKIKVKQ